jgi:pimeloyl-ACP methyl ester carboxylesterase
MAGFEWEGDGPPLLFAHATGFHARLWDEVIRSLPGRRAVALDLRGHGRADQPSIDDGGEAYSWVHFGEDVAAAARLLDLREAIGIGHSMGGHSVTFAADAEPEHFAALVLVDPTIAIHLADRDRSGGGPSFVAKRRNDWSSADEMFERFSGRAPHSLWEPQVLRDYCDYGLLPEGDGFRLACPPATEATIYAMGGYDLRPAVERLKIPVRVVRARPRHPDAPGGAFSGSPTAPDLASWFAHGEDVLLPEHSHFIPMEAPALVARHIAEVAESIR